MLESAGRELPFTEADLDLGGGFGTLRTKLTFQPKTANNPTPRIFGFDTETFEDSSPLCYATSDGRFRWAFGDSLSLSSLFGLLASDNRNLYFCWNLAFDVMVLLKSVPKSTISMERKELNFEYDGIKFDYLYRKSLRLSKGHRTVYLYDCSPLYGRGSLEDMAQKYLGEGKRYEGVYKDKRFPLSLSRTDASQILEYCILDARLTAKLAEQWVTTFRGEFGFYPQRYFSAGSIMAEYVEREIKTYPTFVTAPFSVQQSAYSSYYGGRFEVFRRGSFQNTFHYDINSAYPYAISLLPDIEKGSWKPATDRVRRLGFYKIETSIPPDTQIGPFMFRLGQKVFSPTGRYITWVTGCELATVSPEWYTILDGWEWTGPSSPCELARLMDTLFQIRTVKEEPKRSVYRILMNAIYGKNAQVNPKVGRLFSPIVCAFATGLTRSLLYQAMNQKPDAIVACATDAVFSLESLDLPIGKAMGEWTFTPAKRLDFFMNGLYFEDDKVRSRGFSPKLVLDDGSTVTMTPDSIQVYEREGRAYFKIMNRKPNSLLESLRSKTLNFAEFTLREREIDLNADTKRVWDHEIRHLGETALSKPLTLTG